ncbi:MAG: LamG domain-containing protein [Verrucomicrobia bacterium]|nr:MAG: LamG domain-containing protein [Verrucomicrobiota bacterium]
MKAEGVGQADLRIFAESSSVNSTPLWTLGTSADGDHQGLNTYLRFDSGAAPLVRVFTTNPVLDNTWHHFAWVDQDGVVTVYVDGQPDPVEITHPPLVLSVDTTTLGGIWRSTPSHFFTGQLDDVALWRRPLTQAEVQQLMAEGPVSGPFRIEATTVEGGGVRLEVSVPAATGDYRLEATPTLTAPAWTEVADATVTGPTDGRLTIEFNAPAAPHQFYRVVRR